MFLEGCVDVPGQLNAMSPSITTSELNFKRDYEERTRRMIHRKSYVEALHRKASKTLGKEQFSCTLPFRKVDDITQGTFCSVKDFNINSLPNGYFLFFGLELSISFNKPGLNIYQETYRHQFNRPIFIRNCYFIFHIKKVLSLKRTFL